MEPLNLFNQWWRSGNVEAILAPEFKRERFEEALYYTTNKEINLILLISGLRRVGKSTIMYQIISSLLAKGIDPRKILYYSFDQNVKDPLKILEDYGSIAGVEWERKEIYVFFDEIQKLEGWSAKLKIIYDRFKKIRLVISGSGSFQLEKAALADLTGRHVILKLNPLSFSEFLALKGSKVDIKKENLWEKEIKKEFKNYLFAPFPALVGLKDMGIAKSVIKENVIDKVLKEDIPTIFKDANPQLLLTLVDLFYQKPGMYANYDDISKDLKISKKTLLSHIFYLEFSYLIRRIRNYRPSSKAISRKMQRIYPYHWSLSFGWTGSTDYETIVASVLNAKYYWREGGNEIDFLIKNKGIVPVEVKEKETIDRGDYAKMLSFLKRFDIREGVFVYEGKEGQSKRGGRKIKMAYIPLLQSSHKDLIQGEA